MQRAFSRSLVVTAALLVFVVADASAQGGLNLSWTDCGANGTESRTFACTTNGVVGTLFGSVTPPEQIDQLNGEESEAIIQTNQAALSQWWHLETASGPTPAGCRAGNLVFSNDFTTASGLCSDPWGGLGFGGLNWESNYFQPNHGRLRTAGAIAGSTVMATDREWYIWKVTILGSRTVGTGSCAGCTDGICIAFTSQKLTEPLGVGDYVITNALGREWVTFQPGGATTWICGGRVPTRNRTWGSVKSLYR